MRGAGISMRDTPRRQLVVWASDEEKRIEYEERCMRGDDAPNY
jgi:hypothetical protein